MRQPYYFYGKPTFVYDGVNRLSCGSRLKE